MARDEPVDEPVSSFDSSSDEEGLDDDIQRPRRVPPRAPTPWAPRERSNVPALLPSPVFTGTMLNNPAVFETPASRLRDHLTSGPGDEGSQADQPFIEGVTPAQLAELQRRATLMRARTLAHRCQHPEAYRPRPRGHEDFPLLEEQRFQVYRDEMFAKFYYDYSPDDGPFPNGAKELHEAGLVPEYVEPENPVSYYDDYEEEDDGSVTPAPPPTPRPHHALPRPFQEGFVPVDVDRLTSLGPSFDDMARQPTQRTSTSALLGIEPSSSGTQASGMHNNTNGAQKRFARSSRWLPRQSGIRPFTSDETDDYFAAWDMERSLQERPPIGPRSVPRSMRGAVYTAPARITDNNDREHVLPTDWMTHARVSRGFSFPTHQHLQQVQSMYPPPNVHYTTDPPRGPDWEDPENGSESS